MVASDVANLNQSGQRGMSLLELMVAVGILALVSLVLLRNVTTGYRASQAHRDKLFAFTTATAILAEMHAMVEAAPEDEGIDLDLMDDGATPSPVLSVAKEAGLLVAADHPSSRNLRRNGDWLWSRQISVRPLPGIDNRNLRYVTVTVLKRDGQGIPRPMANLSTVLNSRSAGFPTTQVFDIYLLAIENIPGWWVNMEAMRSFVESTISDLESRNPGLEFRTHWITKASYGRNPVYRPYLNVDLPSTDPIPSAYFYPGLLSEGPITNYYSKDIIRARLATDVGEANGYDVALNPQPYALADFYNHGMRLPEEEAFHEQRVNLIGARRAQIEQAIHDGTAPPDEYTDMSEEPTLRLLLEDLNTEPAKYQNALILNLHGELLPMPAIRNYSDAAKLPGLPATQGMRVVTHPEQLRTARAGALPGEDLKLRVYAYTSDPTRYTGPDAMPTTNPIMVDVMSMNLTGAVNGLATGVRVEMLAGGTGTGAQRQYRPFFTAKHASDSSLQPGEMYYTTEYRDLGVGQEKRTTFRLYNTPVVAPPASDATDPGMIRGLFANERSRLYGLEYVPSCPGTTRDFARDLSTLGDGPKNTARWRITIPYSAFASSMFVADDGSAVNPSGDVMVTVRTRIENDTLADPWSGGVMYPTPIDPENLSQTYSWWTDSPMDVPITERSQFLGDPRHNPYLDLLNGDLDFPNGYNAYHDSLQQGGENAALDFAGLEIPRLASRWMDRVRADMPRYFQLFREGLVSGGAVYSSITGWSYYYAGIGNEIGADWANGYDNSIPVHLGPFGNAGAQGYVNNITRSEGGSFTGGRRLMRSSLGGGDHWVGIPWLGELYPDSVYSTQWMATDLEGKVNGNLFAGGGSGEFYRQLEGLVHNGSRFEAYGTALEVAHQRTQESGCTSFFNIGTAAQTFHHTPTTGSVGSLVEAGPELSDKYNLDLPDNTPISRPFSLSTDRTGDVPPEFLREPYQSLRYSARLLKLYYSHPDAGWDGSGLVQLSSPGGGSSAFVNISGLDKTTEVGTSQIAKFAVLGLVHSYMEAGEPGVSNRIIRMPRIAIHSPTEISELDDPPSVEVQFGIDWRRWDNEQYTAATDPAFFEDESDVQYIVSFSRDDGRSWSYIQDGTVATKGFRPESGANVITDTGSGNERLTWQLPVDEFPEGAYLLRVEAYLGGSTLHYAHHQVRLFINRP